MKVVAIVVTWNGAQWIERCLSSLQESTYPIAAIVIDNASSDRTVAIVKERFPGVQVVETGKNLGFGQANNIGMKMALQQGADYLFLLNQDAWICKLSMQTLISIAEVNPSYGILSPFHLDVGGQKLERQFLDFITANHNDALVSDLFFQKLQPVYSTTYIHAAAWLLTRKCVETVGGFDPLYFHYGEDDDYLQRAKYFGLRIGLVPQATIVHDGTYKTWADLVWNENRNLVVEYQQLKKMFPHFRTNVLAYAKACFDELSTLLLYRKFKKFGFRFKIMWKTWSRLMAIRKSYKQSFTKGAFLN